MSLINCEISLALARTANNQNSTFHTNDTKLYVSAVTLSTQENLKLLKKLEPCSKRTINSSKYVSKTTN